MKHSLTATILLAVHLRRCDAEIDIPTEAPTEAWDGLGRSWAGRSRFKGNGLVLSAHYIYEEGDWEDGDADEEGVIETAKATGYFSTAMGLRTWAAGAFSTATGERTNAKGDWSFTIGEKTKAEADYSIAMGRRTSATGLVSVSMGFNNSAEGDYSTAMGESTVAYGVTSTAMGSQTNASGPTSTAMGSGTNASGPISTAMGQMTHAYGTMSTSMGLMTYADGTGSLAVGRESLAGGDYSAAMGGLTIAEGDYSTAMGWFTDAASYAEVAIGRFNEVPESDDEAWRDADAVFRVGIGSSADDRQYAFRVMKGGQVKVKKNDDESMWDVADELEELNDDMDQAQQDIEKLGLRMDVCPCPPLLAGRRLSPAADDEVETLKKDNEALKARVDALEAAMAKLIK